MTHDFRKIYGYSVFDVGDKVHWGEAIAHLQMLKYTPEAMLYVALSDGEVTRPWSYGEAILYDTFDLLHAANAGKKKPRPIDRPWNSKKKKLGKGAVSIDVAVNIFGRLGHKPNLENQT